MKLKHQERHLKWLSVCVLGSVLEGGCYSGQLKGTFMRKKKYFLRKDFSVTKLLVTLLHVAPAAALLVSSIQVASPGCDIIPGEALVAGLLVPPAGLWSVELVSCPRSHLSFSTNTSGKAEGHQRKAGSLQTPLRRGGPRNRGAWAREAGTTSCNDGYIQCLESHHGNMPGGWGMAPHFLPSWALSRRGAWSFGLVNTNLLAKVKVFKDITRQGLHWVNSERRERGDWSPSGDAQAPVCKRTRSEVPFPESWGLSKQAWSQDINQLKTSTGLMVAVGWQATAGVSNWDGDVPALLLYKTEGLGVSTAQLDHVCSQGWVASLAIESVQPLSPHFFFWWETEPIGRGAASAISWRERAQGSQALPLFWHSQGSASQIPRVGGNGLGVIFSTKQRQNKHFSCSCQCDIVTSSTRFSEVQSMKLIWLILKLDNPPISMLFPPRPCSIICII